MAFTVKMVTCLLHPWYLGPDGWRKYSVGRSARMEWEENWTRLHIPCCLEAGLCHTNKTMKSIVLWERGVG